MIPEWFQNPRFVEGDDRLAEQVPDRPEEAVTFGAPLTVTEEGQVSGHVALWGRCHVGFGNTCVTPPKEPGTYRGYLTGEAMPGVATGPIVLGGGHAPLSMSAGAATNYYDSTSRAVADVTVGTDDYGIWAAGAVRDGTPTSDVAALRGSAISGDWRTMGGQLRLIALLAVNSPGFRVTRPYAMAASGALITQGPACIPCSDGEPHETLEERVDRLERLALGQLTAAV